MAKKPWSECGSGLVLAGPILNLKAENRVFEHLAATIDASFNLTGAGRPERIEGARVSSSLFTLFDVKPVLGRVFNAEEDGEGKATTAILSYAFWQRHFGGSQDVVGKTLSLNGNSVEIVGVMPEGFTLNKEVMPTVNKIPNTELCCRCRWGRAKETFGRTRTTTYLDGYVRA